MNELSIRGGARTTLAIVKFLYLYFFPLLGLPPFLYHIILCTHYVWFPSWFVGFVVIVFCVRDID